MIHGLSTNTKSIFTFEKDDENRIQPNAFDFKISRVFRFKTDLFVLNEDDSKTHRVQEEIFPDENGFWYLEPGSYEVVMENIITEMEIIILDNLKNV